MITEIKIELTNHYALVYCFDKPVHYNSKEMLKGFKKLMEITLDHLSFFCDYGDDHVFIDSLWYLDAEDNKYWRI